MPKYTPPTYEELKSRLEDAERKLNNLSHWRQVLDTQANNPANDASARLAYRKSFNGVNKILG